MNLTLARTDKEVDGIFGTLVSEDGSFSCITLEHAYDSGNGDGSYAPKTLPGIYKCVRGEHQLAHMTSPFTTFMITHDDGHTNVLFHVGNFNEDSEGCILLGRRVVPRDPPETGNMITSSKNTFNAFMDLQKDVTEFILTVRD